MLSPKKVKWRKLQKGRRGGTAWRGSSLAFGDFGLQTLDRAWLTAREIEAARVALTRAIKRGGRVWTRVFPDKPLTKKPAETRMGKGKGAPEIWVAVVKPGRMLFEMEGVEPAAARAALKLAAAKLSVMTQIRERRSGSDRMKITELRNLSSDELHVRERDLADEIFHLRLRRATAQLTNPMKLRESRRTLARVKTLLRERTLQGDAAK